ncbi:MAG: transcriptional regulator [Chloroflexales bacterium]|nr:transcriptional regulator [Chloroflexales bacterium]
MGREHMLLRTKLVPPRPHRRALPRPALTTKLREALEYRVTIVQAGTGYGKTTALASLGNDDTLVFWYSAEEDDADPQRFLLYLIAAFRSRLPELSDLPLATLRERGSDGSFEGWSQTLDVLINMVSETLSRPALLVIDDFYFVARTPEIWALTERLIVHQPEQLHCIISTRYPLSGPGLTRWRARGEVLEIGDSDLAFRPDEIDALFRQTYGMLLTPFEIKSLAEKTDGWPISLQLVWQGLRNGIARSVADLLTQGPSTLAALFDYLARDVFEIQPPEIAAFLRETAALRELTPEACDAVRGVPARGAHEPGADHPSSLQMLKRLHQLDLFVVGMGEHHYRYHHLFHDFLRRQSDGDPETWRARHLRAARFFADQQNDDEAIYHWLEAEDFAAAAAAIALAGEEALYSGRLDTVAAWIDAIPPDVLAEHPLLLVYRGDVFRMRTSFDKALAWYASAEQSLRARNDLPGLSRALRGQAHVYLDTVQPAQAERLLEEALRLIDGIADRETRARLLELAAENRLNMGDPGGAEQTRAEARALREAGPGEDIVSMRVKFRTGRIFEARRALEEWIAAEHSAEERGQSHQPLAHREPALLLSLTYAFLGQIEPAITLARQGIALGERLALPFISAVALTRLGHAVQLQRGPGLPPASAREEAIRSYQASLALDDHLAVRRTRMEAMWGMTRAYGFFGDLAMARRVATESIEMARTDGDAWLAALIELALGSSAVLAGQPDEAVQILTRALKTLSECGDRLGPAAARLWLCLAYLDLQQGEHFVACAEVLLEQCEAHGYDFLFTLSTFLGPPDPHRLVPLLIEARGRRLRPAYVARLLSAIGLPEIQTHPGYQLRVQTLGAFRVWRGEAEVEPREWQRDKARQLFQLLISRRGGWLQRDEIVEHLWADLAPEVASRDLKVALNVLNKVLEPARSADTASAYIVREGTVYRLRPAADLWLDSAQFEQLCQAGLGAGRRAAGRAPLAADGSEQAIRHLRSALQLYGGDYLPDARYESWAIEARDRLRSLYLRSADRLAELLLEQGQPDEAIDVCEHMLMTDPCWERAYRLMMQAYARQGNAPVAVRVYQRCARMLHDLLGVAPSPDTETLYRRLLSPRGA